MTSNHPPARPQSSGNWFTAIAAMLFLGLLCGSSVTIAQAPPPAGPNGPGGTAFGPKQPAGPGNPLGLNPVSPLNAQNPNSFSNQMTRLQQQQQLQNQQKPGTNSGPGNPFSAMPGSGLGPNLFGNSNFGPGINPGFSPGSGQGSSGALQAGPDGPANGGSSKNQMEGLRSTPTSTSRSPYSARPGATASLQRISPTDPKALVTPSPTRPSI